MPLSRLFGTDGIRSKFGVYPLDGPTVVELGLQLATKLRRSSTAAATPRIILGGDTRDSTPVICGWLAHGFERGGAAFTYVGVLPTPGIAYLTRHWPQGGGAACGVAVSASHNLHPDNGIKLLTRQGFKWSAEQEGELERRLGRTEGNPPVPPQRELDVAREAPVTYFNSLMATVRNLDSGPGSRSSTRRRPGPGRSEEPRPLAGIKLAMDAANGAASPFAKSLFEDLGATVEAIHHNPDGRNINARSGSTQPEDVARLTRTTGSDLGIAFDGDADRAVLIDETGQVQDGDAILYLWAKDLKERGQLDPPKIVATHMSNLGLERALARLGIEVVRCDVGDRIVVQTMEQHGILLGGEQSGHVIHLGLSTTGDGMLTALQMAHLLKRSGTPLSQLLEGFERYPQILTSVRVASKRGFASLPGMTRLLNSVDRRLGDEGRLVLRYSGTEPLARIMMEGPDRSLIEALTSEVAEKIRHHLGSDGE